ncbi:cation:proton antiporter [Mycobacterium sp. SMC-4]|nr:monovalent cation/H+ antiporter complex subunit F [Mycobacterium sp. SMC-4]UXA18572.1 cation:proton antiporter [Mycobacterium sp. SMC-4]
MTAIWWASAVILCLAATITMYRVLAGPNTMDRLVATDTLVAVMLCGLATWAAYTLDTTVKYGIVALSLMAFVGSVSVARFRVPDKDGGPRS